MPDPNRRETPITTEWNINQAKDSLIRAANKKLEPINNFPEQIMLNDVWVRVMESVFHQTQAARDGVEFLFEHPEENGRLIKTDSHRQKLLIQSENTTGSDDHVATQGIVTPPEVLVGVIHKHPSIATFNTEDLLPLLSRDQNQLFAGLVDPEFYYFAFRSSDTPILPGPREVIRGYLLELARNHYQRIHHHRLGLDAAEMTPDMAKEIKMPIYKGKRSQTKFTRVF